MMRVHHQLQRHVVVAARVLGEGVPEFHVPRVFMAEVVLVLASYAARDSRLSGVRLPERCARNFIVEVPDKQGPLAMPARFRTALF